MKESICIWKGCKKKVKLDDSIEKRISWVTVSGWCKLHKKAYHIYHDMELKKFGYLTSKIYKENKKELNRMEKEAERYSYWKEGRSGKNLLPRAF